MCARLFVECFSRLDAKRKLCRAFQGVYPETEQEMPRSFLGAAGSALPGYPDREADRTICAAGR